MPASTNVKSGFNPHQPLDLSAHTGEVPMPTYSDQMQKAEWDIEHHPSPSAKQNRSVKTSDKWKRKAYVKLNKINLQPGQSIKLSQNETAKLQSTAPTSGVTLSDIEKETNQT